MRFNKIVFPVRRRGSTGAIGSQGPAGPLTAADEARLSKVEDLLDDGTKRVYVDGINGSDSNSGLSVASAFQSLGPAIEARDPLKVNEIEIVNSCELNDRVSLLTHARVNIVRHSSAPSDTKITVNGDSSLIFTTVFNFSISGVDIELNGVARFINAFINSFAIVRVANLIVTRTSLNTAPMFDSFGGGLLVHGQNSDFSAVSGYLFDGVAAGDDPNDVVFVETNILSA